jgi:hypothetical protein
MPENGADFSSWIKSRSSLFRYLHGAKIHAIRDELAHLHIQDERLDEFVDMLDIDNMPIHPQECEEMADRLRTLARQIAHN